MQKLENRCDLLLTQHQKWMASVTRFIVAHGMGSPHLHGYHRLTLAHFFLPEKGTIISVAPQGLYQVVNPGTPPFIPAIQEGLMTSIQTHEIMLLTHFNLGGVLLSELHRLGESRLANRLNSQLRRFDDRDLYHTLIWLCWYDLMCAHSMQPWTEELKHKSHAELESWAVARKREKRELELMIDEYLLYAC